MRTEFIKPGGQNVPASFPYPLVVKPANGHGGDRVSLVENKGQFDEALASILPDPAIVQETASDAGKDLRIYVLFGEIKAAVLRTAAHGIVSKLQTRRKRGAAPLNRR